MGGRVGGRAGEWVCVLVSPSKFILFRGTPKNTHPNKDPVVPPKCIACHGKADFS